MSMTTEEKLQQMLGDYYQMGSPGSPNAAILQNILGAENELRDPQSENEALLKLIYEDGQLINQEAIERCEAAQEACEQTAAAVASHTAAVYDSTKTYAVGDYVVYDGALYKCTTAVTTAEEWTAAHWTETTVGEELTGLQNQLDEAERQIDAVSIKDTATGAIASFPDGADNMPLKSLVINIEPVQDLHGFEKPWPGGAVDNKLSFGAAFTETVNGITIKSDGRGTYTLSGTASAQADFKFNIPEVTMPSPCYIHVHNSAAGSSAGAINLEFYNGETRKDYWGFSTANRIGNSTSALGGQTINALGFLIESGEAISGTLTISPMALETSTPTDFIPWSNICPISGHTGANVTAAGKNLLKLNNGTYTVAHTTVTVSNGTITVTGDSTSGGRTTRLSDVFLLKAGTYKISHETTSPILVLCLNRADNNTLVGSLSNPYITISEDVYVYAGVNTATATYSGQSITPMLELGSTATTYEPYSGTSLALSFGQTVYGGTDEVVSGSGEKTMEIVDLGSLTWYYNATYSVFYGTLLDYAKPDSTTVIANILCTSYAPVSLATAVNPSSDFICSVGRSGLFDNSLLVKDSRYTDTETFKTAVTGQKLVYELATPSDFSTTEITDLVTLKGDNNVWNDCGDTTVEYTADPQKYINKIVTEAVANALV